MQLTSAELHALAEDLRGSTQNVEDAFQRLKGHSWDNVDKESLEEFDQLVFLCDRCGWWCGADEESEREFDCERVCDDCEGD